jgi:Flp pilus assembly protein protease CpaA
MASEGSSSGIVAIFAIMLLVLIGGFIAWQAGVFGGGDGDRDIDVNVDTPMK